MARESLRKAREFCKTRPDDLPGQLEALERAAWDARETPVHDEAARELEAVKVKAKALVDSQLQKLEDTLRPLVRAEEFGRALDHLRQARATLVLADWTTALDRKGRELEEQAKQLYAPLKERALQANAKRAAAEVEQARGRVSKWGFPDLLRDLDGALTAAVPAPAPAVDKPLPEGFSPLFNGKDLTGWNVSKGRWIVEDGALVADPSFSDHAIIMTAETYRDYELTCKVKVPGNGYAEAHIHGYGHVFGLNLEAGAWRELRVTARGNGVEATLDGVKLRPGEGGGSNRQAEAGTIGFFCLQGLGLRIKDLSLKSLKQAPPPTLPKVIQFSFDGKDKVPLLGRAKEGVLEGLLDNDTIVAGVEALQPIGTVPPQGEFVVTYVARTPAVLHAVVRARKGGSTETTYFYWEVEKAVTGRKVQLRLPLSEFKSYAGGKLEAGDPIQFLYVILKDPKGQLSISDLAIVGPGK